VINPFLYQEILGISPGWYGTITFFIALGLVVGGTISSRRVERWGVNCLLLRALILILLAGLVLVITALLQILNVYLLSIPIFFVTIGAGIIYPNSYSGAFTGINISFGIAGALFGCSQILTSSVVSVAAAKLPEHNQMPLGMIFIGLALLGLLVYATVTRRYSAAT